MATTSKGRVFLSYGHDAACEGLVERIKADLEAQGWEPWVDRHRIEFGDDWRREITKGIRESQHVLAFLSRHSTRKPGVCRQEVAIALGPLRGHVYTVLVEPLSEVTPPLIVSRLQWLDMQRWREMQESDPAGFDALYRDCVAQILRVLERNQPFAGEIDELHRWLQPLDATGDMIDAEAGFHGRDWLLGGIGGASPMFDGAADVTTAGEIETWRTGGSGGRVLWLAAQPGWGKSAVAARLAHAGRSRVLAVHFCKHDRPGTRDARQVVRTLAFQMSTQLGDYRQLLLSEARRGLGLNEMNAKELFHALLVNPLAHVLHGDGASDDLRLLVVDALDETLDANGRSELLGLIASDFQRLPPWLGLVVTSRPEAPIIRQLGKFGVKMLAADDPRNLEDLRESADGWLQTLSSQGFDRRRALNAIMQACSGNFLYLRKLREAVAEGVVSVENLQEPGSLPGGLSSLYERWFQHRFHDVTDYQTRIRPLLEMMLAARQPLPIELAGHVLSWGAYGGKVTQMLGTLCAIEDGALSFFHKSLRDWLADPEASGWDFHVDEEQGHRLLADYMWSAFLAARPFVEVFGASRGWGRLGASAADYALRHLPAHLRRLDRGEDVREALLDFGFAMNRCAIGGVEPFLEDYREVRESRCEQLTAWADCILGRSHILRRGDEKWPSHKILLQLAMEHADDSPITHAAATWLEGGRCDWAWVWDARRPRRLVRSSQVSVMEGGGQKVEAVWGLPGGRLLSRAGDSVLRLWDLETGLQLNAIPDFGRPPMDFRERRLVDVCRATGRVIGLVSGKISARDLENLDPLTEFEADHGGHDVHGLRVLGSERVLTWTAAGSLHLWSLSAKKMLSQWQAHDGPILGVDALPDGRILTWSRDKTLRITYPDGRADPVSFVGHANAIRHGMMLADGRLLSWAGAAIHVWDADSGQLLLARTDHENEVNRVIAVEGGYVSCSTDGSVRLRDRSSLLSVATVTIPVKVAGVAAHPRSRVVFWANLGDELFLWDYGSRAEPLRLFGHEEGGVLGVKVLEDGTFLSWSRDRTIRLWRADPEPQTLFLGEHPSEPVDAVRVSADRIVTWDDSGLIRCWRVPRDADRGRWASATAPEKAERGEPEESVRPSEPEGVELYPESGPKSRWEMERKATMDASGGVRVLTDEQAKTLERAGSTVLDAYEWCDHRLMVFTDDRRLLLWDLRASERLAELELCGSFFGGWSIIDDRRVLVAVRLGDVQKLVVLESTGRVTDVKRSEDVSFYFEYGDIVRTQQSIVVFGRTEGLVIDDPGYQVSDRFTIPWVGVVPMPTRWRDARRAGAAVRFRDIWVESEGAFVAFAQADGKWSSRWHSDIERRDWVWTNTKFHDERKPNWVCDRIQFVDGVYAARTRALQMMIGASPYPMRPAPAARDG